MNGMISRRKFISMTMMMVVLLFMFQFTQAVKDMENEYNVNDYAKASVLDGTSAWQMRGDTQSQVSIFDMKQDKYVAFLGDSNSQLGLVVQQWCTYTKRDMMEYATVEELSEIKKKKPEIVLIDSEYVDFRTQTDDLTKLADKGISMVFCNLPEAEIIDRYQSVRKLLGIKSVETEEARLTGIKLFAGFLLGGEVVYQVQQEEDVLRQDLDLTAPWYVAFGGTKTYMVGLPDEALVESEDIDNEYLPALIWRNSYGDAKIFAVNGDYMYDSMGIGILDAMMAELHSYEIYPVVNAQNLTITNFPGFAEENTDELMRIYSRDAGSLFQDIMWPAITSIAGKTEHKETVYFMAQADYMDKAEAEDDDYVFYLKELKEQEAEAGVSLELRTENVTLDEKLKRDADFYEKSNDGYLFTSAYVGDSQNTKQVGKKINSYEAYKNLNTVVQKYDATAPLLSYLDEDVTLQNTTSDGCNYTYSQDLRMRSLQTSLAYSNILLDMYHVAWPRDGADSWENVYDVFSRNINTFWKSFDVFDKTNVSESDKRVRALLGLNYADRREGDIVYLQVENLSSDGAWFMLRTHGEEIAQISGAEATEIEEGAYLLQIKKSVIRIELQDAQGPYYYMP